MKSGTTRNKNALPDGAIIDAVFSKLVADKNIDIVLIAGDLTSTGAMESHLDLLPKLLKAP